MTDERTRLVPADPTGFMLDEIARPETTREDMAKTYALAARDHWDVRWPEMNAAIVERLTRKDLDKIKAAAWKKIETGEFDA